VSDQGKWAKVWVSSLRDPSLDSLSLEDWARWMKMVILVKEQGDKGTIKIENPSPSIYGMLRVTNWDEMMLCFKRFPNCEIVTIDDRYINLTFHNWYKFQGDNSIDRVRKYRANVTPKKRREESTPYSPPIDNGLFSSFLRIVLLLIELNQCIQFQKHPWDVCALVHSMDQ